MLLGPLAALALLLLAAGVAKLVAPEATAAALVALGLPPGASPGWGARALGAGEVALSVWVLTAGSRAAAMGLALAHLAFTAVTVRLISRPSVPCGCFGAPDAPATPAGVVSNAASTIVASAAAVWPPGTVLHLARDGLVETALVLVLACLGAWLVHQAHVALPSLERARREGAVRP